MKNAGDNYWLPVKTLYSPAIFIIPIPKNRNFQLRMCTLVEGIKLFAILINLLGVQHAAELYCMLLMLNSKILAKSKPNTTVFNL